MATASRIDYNTLSPYVRYVHEIVIPQGAMVPERYIYDYEFIYVVSGSGCLRIESNEYTMAPGALLYIRPHKLNEMIVSDKEPMHCFAVHFDYVFLGEAADFSPYSVYLGQKQTEGVPDAKSLQARPNVELVDLDIPEHMTPSRIHPFHEVFRELTFHFHESRADAQIWLKSSILRLLGLVHQELTTKEGIWIEHTHADLMLDAIQFLQQQYKKKVDLPVLAARAKLTPKYFGTLFKQATGQSVSQYLLRLRMEEAKRLLRLNKFTIEEIADQVGIGDLFYFSKLFKKTEGMSPKKYADSLNTRHYVKE
ncbi:AraC family transcriptional regulator [Paenibacillus roseipurpureus]|uniref:AraC family transcriptional regulator n=1 Tax=Paenibacillus roseopurpureus TaxID=2918901 RepID=A0AA96LRN9_9BACL|nr:AraC family transcriptional regulator [Paenibacillus sp. MBLB1832]WNR45326.1 AraC family transcriptional regulator [Paenibacillus sp. MBLB1832]